MVSLNERVTKRENLNVKKKITKIFRINVWLHACAWLTNSFMTEMCGI